MKKFYDNFKDQNVSKVAIYDNGNGVAYKDPECTEVYSTSELRDAYVKGSVIIGIESGYEQIMLSPLGFAINSNKIGAVGYFIDNDGTVERIYLVGLPDDPDALKDCTIRFDLDDSWDVLGKEVRDLQSDINLVGNSITGDSKYVTEYTGFSSDENYQSGNYLVFAVSSPNVSNVSVSASEIYNTVWVEGVLLCVIRVSGLNSTVDITIGADGYTSKNITLNLSLLTCEPAPNNPGQE